MITMSRRSEVLDMLRALVPVESQFHGFGHVPSYVEILSMKVRMVADFSKHDFE